MVEIAVDLMSIHNTAQSANASKEEEGLAEELQHPQVWVVAIIMQQLVLIVRKVMEHLGVTVTALGLLTNVLKLWQQM